MLDTIKKILGLSPRADLALLVKNGAQVIDVRTPEEYRQGHIKSSVNIPLQQLRAGFAKIKKDKPVITCCASGMRSASAKSLLQANGFGEVYNGGGWRSLQQKLNKA